MRPRLEKIMNTTDVPTALVRQIVRFVLPTNIRPVEFTVRVTNGSWGIRGRYLSGSGQEQSWKSFRG